VGTFPPQRKKCRRVVLIFKENGKARFPNKTQKQGPGRSEGGHVVTHNKEENPNKKTKEGPLTQYHLGSGPRKT